MQDSACDMILVMIKATATWLICNMVIPLYSCDVYASGAQLILQEGTQGHTTV